MHEANKGNSVEGVNMGYPHHSSTDGRIRSLILLLRKKVLNGDKIDPFVLGCLCHLIQDRAVHPHADSRYQDFMEDMARFRIKYEWRMESLPLWSGSILNNLSDVLTLQTRSSGSHTFLMWLAPRDIHAIVTRSACVKKYYSLPHIPQVHLKPRTFYPTSPI